MREDRERVLNALTDDDAFLIGKYGMTREAIRRVMRNALFEIEMNVEDFAYVSDRQHQHDLEEGSDTPRWWDDDGHTFIGWGWWDEDQRDAFMRIVGEGSAGGYSFAGAALGLSGIRDGWLRETYLARKDWPRSSCPPIRETAAAAKSAKKGSSPLEKLWPFLAAYKSGGEAAG